ncbi:MAG: hypothetical protein NT154_03620 [Verrucomicrobia bacterium]|nr:hypothetical protein [Verrucomicrobiota bacterium]
MKSIACVVLSVVFLAACNSFGKEAPKNNPFNKTLSAVPAAELPAKAADLVLHAKARDRQATTINVVKSAVGLNPAAAPAIVGAVARAVPEMAAVAAGTASAEQPKQASDIAKAAAAAAPSQAGKIVAAVCRAVPNECRNVAVAVSQVVPSVNKDILLAVASALPDLKPAIDKLLAGNNGNVWPVGATLDQASALTQTGSAVANASTPSARSSAAPVLAGGAPMPRPPAIGPPYWPLTKTPTNVTSGTSSAVPPGGRNYAAP